MRKYPSGRRGSPAKGVDVQTTCEGSNPSFRANHPKALKATKAPSGLFPYAVGRPIAGSTLSERGTPFPCPMYMGDKDSFLWEGVP